MNAQETGKAEKGAGQPVIFFISVVRKWISVTRLKENRLWSDGKIKRWLDPPPKSCFVMRYGSAAVRSDIVQLLPMTAHCACVSVRSPKREFTTDIAGYT